MFNSTHNTQLPPPPFSVHRNHPHQISVGQFQIGLILFYIIKHPIWKSHKDIANAHASPFNSTRFMTRDMFD